ncbi:sigma-54-dependent Fis family transcriptional regulator [Clostridium sediminicola]|uniref:sigma 54-interacting transcriptional regulator n=1 Tax=Clostridium sediminicola TaxID=3114879 RepID=UPI0031F22094
MNKFKIGCLTYKKLDILAQQAVKQINDPTIEIILVEGLMEQLIDKVNQEMRNGVDVFIGGGANAKIVSKYTSVNVVNIKLTFYDYFYAVLEAKKVSNKIGIVNYIETAIMDFSKIEEGLGVEITSIKYKDKDELYKSINESECEVVIGASLANEVASELGMPSVLIYPGIEAIINTILEAKEISIAIRNEKEKSKIFQTVLEFSPSGIILTDENSEIIFFNPAVEKIFGINSLNAVGESIEQILPECELDSVIESGEPQLSVINRVRNNDVVVNRIPLEIDNNVMGSIAIIDKVSEIQKTEQKIRINNNRKGFYAKNHFSNIIGSSNIMMEKIEEAKLYARTNYNVLITGETGTGKEIFAQSIHNYSYKYNGPFVAVNCAAIPDNLLESELFGYDEGAFTGTKAGGKAGFFEIAHNGTIFLDEIGELPLSLQSRLLRVIQEKEVIRVGGDRVIPVDVRIIAATNKNLLKKIPDEFRMDLYYRINVLELDIPSLIKREDDVIEIFEHFISNNKDLSRYKIEIPKDIYKVLKHYSWPGNIRELQNVSERFSLFLSKVNRNDLSAYHEILIKAIGEKRIIYDVFNKRGINYDDKIKIEKYDENLVDELLYIFSNQKNKVANILGINRTTLWRKMKTLQKDKK